MQVALEHVTKIHANGTKAVEDLSIEVADGELVALVGPSGSGKTTTLRLIAGLDTASAGTIRIGSRVVNALPPKDRDVAMVFQQPALYPHLTVFQNLAFALRLRGISQSEIGTRVRRAAGILGLDSLLDRRPNQLSGGERQRVALGRAIVREPACFLLDEPFSSLDANLRSEMRGELRRLHRTLGATILHVTHDQEEAMMLGDRIVVLQNGRIQQAGEPLEIYQRPANRLVAGFFGSPPMNFLEGVVVEEHDRLWFDVGTCRLPMPKPLAMKIGQRITLGIRPEDICEEPGVDGCWGSLEMQVLATEPLGDRTHVHLANDRHPRVVARFGPRDYYTPGMRMRICLNMDRAHYFAAADRIPAEARG